MTLLYLLNLIAILKMRRFRNSHYYTDFSYLNLFNFSDYSRFFVLCRGSNYLLLLCLINFICQSHFSDRLTHLLIKNILANANVTFYYKRLPSLLILCFIPFLEFIILIKPFLIIAILCLILLFIIFHLII